MKKIFTYYEAIKRILDDHGIHGLKVILEHSIDYIKYKLFKRGHFQFGEKQLPYFYHWYGHTYRTERIVEIPIAIEFLKYNNWKDNKKILEIGDVISHYKKINYEKHHVVDKYADDNPNVINEDVVDFQSKNKYDIIISISTMEHVGWDELPREKDKFLKGLNNMLNLLEQDGKMLVTVPLGHNEHLDKYFDNGSFSPFNVGFLQRVSKDNRWEEVSYKDINDYHYDKPYPFGNVIMVLTKE